MSNFCRCTACCTFKLSVLVVCTLDTNILKNPLRLAVNDNHGKLRLHDL